MAQPLTGAAGRVQQRLLRFDAGAALLELLRDLRAPKRWVDRLAAILAPFRLDQGLESLRALADDPALKAPLVELAREARGALAIKLWAYRIFRRAPQELAAQQALVTGLLEARLGLPLAELRAEVAALPDQRLTVVYGPVSRWIEALGLLLHEPFALLLQAAHGTRAQEVFLPATGTERALLDVLLSPDHPRVALIGHGTWSSFLLDGYFYTPDALLAELCARAREAPADAASALTEGHLYHLLHRPPARGALKEEDLAALVQALGELHPKEMVIRHTCGNDRYELTAPLLWHRAPPELVAKLERRLTGFGARRPSEAGSWEPDLTAWLGDRPVVRERPAFGRSLVRDPSATRGYEGTSWIPDFVATPVPDPSPQWAFPLAPDPIPEGGGG
jgi:hypothetical protein